MNQRELILAARAASASHKLVPELVCAVVEQESNWDQWLNRYEPDFEANPKYGPTIASQAHEFSASSLTKFSYETTWQTEIKNRCTSWGLMQVLGQVARELGFKEPIPSLCDVSNGLEIGCLELSRKIEEAGGDLHAGLQRFNGGSDLNYA